MTRHYSSRGADGQPSLLMIFVDQALTKLEKIAAQPRMMPPLAALAEAAANVDLATEDVAAMQAPLFVAAGVPGFQTDPGLGLSAEETVQRYRAAHQQFFAVYFGHLETEAAARDRAMALVAAGQARVTLDGDIEALPAGDSLHAQA